MATLFSWTFKSGIYADVERKIRQQFNLEGPNTAAFNIAYVAYSTANPITENIKYFLEILQHTLEELNNDHDAFRDIASKIGAADNPLIAAFINLNCDNKETDCPLLNPIVAN